MRTPIKDTSHKETHQEGNVLFLILIAVMLFAGLTYAVTYSGRDTGGAATEDALKTEASVVLQHVTMVENAIQRMIWLKGVQVSELQLHPDVNNPNCTSNICDVYHIDGGGLFYSDPDDDWLDQSIKHLYLDYRIWEFYPMKVQNVGTTDGTSNSSDLVIMIEAMDPDLCGAVNELVGIPGVPEGEDYASGGGKYAGTFTNAAVIGDDSPELAGHRTGCFSEIDGTPSHMFYHVLIER